MIRFSLDVFVSQIGERERLRCLFTIYPTTGVPANPRMTLVYDEHNEIQGGPAICRFNKI